MANRLVRVLDPELAAKNKPELSTWTYRYNPAGEKIKETNALGHSTSYAYNGAGRLLQVTDPQGVSVAYSYDRAGNKTGMTDGRGKATSYTYGAFGLLRSATDPTRKPIVYRYNLASSVAEMTDRNGNHTVYAYDNRNLLTSRSVTETGDSIGYGYDETGNRISMTDASGTSSYAYDKNNRLLRITKDGAERIAYTYDAVGNTETITDSTGFATSYAYDKSSRLETVSFQGKVTTYQYDDNGNRKAIVYGGGVTEQYEFDRNSRLIGLTNKKPDGSVLSSYRYTYDEAGQQTSKTDSFGTTDYAYDEAGRLLKVNAPGKTTLYGYDRAGNRQSQQETYTSTQPSGYVDPGTETELTYLVKKSEYVYTASNQLQKLIEKMADGAGQEVLEKTVLYLYDDNGNELRQQVSYIRPHKRSVRQVTGGNAVGDDADADLTPLIEKVSNVFDGFNRLKQTERIKAGERVTVDYVYDGDDLRAQKVVRSSKESYAAKTTNYLYDRQHVILESDASGSVAVRYVRGINYIARIDASAKLSYFLYNGHGDVVQTVSEAGEVENQYDYDAFGNATLTVESEYSSAIRYAGEFFDAEVGLYYLRARYYNPYTGRFISEDSYWGEDANPLSLNRYTYAWNSPLMYVDPTGHNAERINEIIEEIDKQKEAWWNAEYDESLDGYHRSLFQQQAHEAANGLRQELAELEKGKEQVAQLVADNGNEAAGDWESYKRDFLSQEIERKISEGVSVTPEEVDEYQKLNAMVTVAKNLGRDVISSDIHAVERQLERDLGLDMYPVKVASLSDVKDVAVESAKFSKHFAIGAWTGIKNSANDAWELIKHPLDTAATIKELGSALWNYRHTGDPDYLLPLSIGMLKSAVDEVERWQEGDRYERTEQVGEYVGGGLAVVGAAKGISYVLKEVKLASKIIKGKADPSEIVGLIDRLDSPELKADVANIAIKSRLPANNYNQIQFTGTTKVSGIPRDISRRVYQRNDIDWDQVDPDTGKTNKELAQGGYAPYWKDGTKVELHHTIQIEPGPVVEIPSSLHQEYSKTLHGLVEDGASFRNNEVLDKQFNNFRKQYWKWRANQLDD